MFDFLFGNNHRARAQRDQWRPTVIGKNLISPINDYGTCFSCQGGGSRSLNCNACSNSGTHSRQCPRCCGAGEIKFDAKPCFACSGSGQKWGNSCRRCEGSGTFKPAALVPCKKCCGAGQLSDQCRRCSGLGCITVSCRKCGGSGWHKF